mmetsp:Transcript_34667/g.103278  ORF Transcript_34667/g.103278 Transcript_34667/m.103278 type:complete len:397 (+) Transcript_34667:590-1780(+)
MRWARSSGGTPPSTIPPEARIQCGFAPVAVGDAAIAEQRRQLLLARRHVLLQRAGRRLRLLKERGELGDRGERERRAREGRDRLCVRVGLGVLEELPPVGEGGLRDGDPASVQPLADHLKGLDRLARQRVSAVGAHLCVPRQERGARQRHAVERDPRVVEVVADSLRAHVARRDSRCQPPAGAHVHQKGVRAFAFSADGKVGQDDRLVGHEALRDPVLVRPVRLAHVGQDEAVCALVEYRLCLHDQARLHAGELLRERKAAELAGGLDVVERRDLLVAPDGEHRPEAQVVVHREPDPEAGTLLHCVARKEAVRLEEAFGAVAEVGVPKQASLDEGAQTGRAVLERARRVVDRVSRSNEVGLPPQLLLVRGGGRHSGGVAPNGHGRGLAEPPRRGGR